MVLREGESISLDGPGKIVVKRTGKNRTVILVDADDETTVKKRDAKEGIRERYTERGQNSGPSHL